MAESMSEQELVQALSQISSDEKAEILSIWMKNPHISVFDLAEQLENSTEKKFPIPVLKREIELLGLDKVSEEKKKELSAKS